jgi:hypothetical protein
MCNAEGIRTQFSALFSHVSVFLRVVTVSDTTWQRCHLGPQYRQKPVSYKSLDKFSAAKFQIIE